MQLTLKTMLKATLGCVLLTLGWYFFIRPLPVRIDYLREFELIGVWSVLLIGWIIYFTRFFRKRNRKE